MVTLFSTRRREAESRRQAGLEAVIDAFESPLLRYAAGLLRDEALAQDAVQNAFIKLAQRWTPDLTPDDRLRAWLYRVVHNEAVDIIRAESRRKSLKDRFARQNLPGAESVALPDEPFPDERMGVVLRCLATLNATQRQVVLLRLQQGLGYDEIARVTGRTAGTCRNVLHEAVAALSLAVRRLEGDAQ